ncbi:MAG TPA: CHAD domain-containing protein [Solirubrobacterales bacterium]|nr:CHAD domain-containing protein [Solirubrobacterales bacterium]
MAASDPGRSYGLTSDEEPIAGLARVAAGRAEQALERLRASLAGEAGTAEAVHGARKDMKKLRTVLRLLRAELGSKRCKRANRRCRDAGRALSASRDAEVKLATLDALAEQQGALPAAAVDAWRKILERDRDAAADGPGEERAIEEAISLIAAGLQEVESWEFGDDRWKPVGSGLERTHRRGRRAMKAARRGGGEADFHHWRKRAKDHWHELRLFSSAWPGPLEALAEEAHRLSEQLGDHHDLAVLREDLRGRNLGEAETAALEAAIDRRQEELAVAAFALGARLYAERPKDFSRRLREYWEARRLSNPEVGKSA